MHVVVVTCAHRGDDARIVHRQARSLLTAGHRVSLVAPLPPADSLAADPDGLRRIGVPRAHGRRRIRSWRATRRAVRDTLRSEGADVVVLHDPELLALFARRRSTVPMIWDVHEDYVASIPDRRYVPRVLRRPVRAAVEALERRAVRRCHLILAEDAYADRLGPHPVVPNGTWVPSQPAPLDDLDADARPRLVYAGRVSAGRGALELVQLGERLRDRVTVEIIGDADRDVHEALAAAHAAGHVRWRGYLPNPVALERIHGAFAGLSLLHLEPNYVHSRPTKLVEYLAHGVPVISTRLPLAAALVAASDGGAIVDEPVVDAAITVVERWLDRPDLRAHHASSGHRYVAEHHAWQRDGDRFVELLERWADRRDTPCPQGASPPEAS